MPSEVVLTEQQQQEVLDLFIEVPDLIEITRRVFKDDTLDGRSKEGRAVREFLASRGKQYKTTKKEPAKAIELSAEHQEFILKNADSMRVFDIAKLLFPQSNIVSTLSKECRVVLDFLRKEAPELIANSDSAIGIEYKPPDTVEKAVSKINRAAVLSLDPERLSALHRQCIAAYIRFVGSPRIVQIINNMQDIDDRTLFENEFTRFTWDKPDLTSDEIALYITVCQDIIMETRLLKHLELLNKMFDDAASPNQDRSSDTGKKEEVSIRLSEAIRAKSEEYDKVKKRQETLIKKLNGDRSQRLAAIGQRSASVLALVEAWQNQEERVRLLRIAEAQREKISTEADRLETLEDFHARILGVSKEEAT